MAILVSASCVSQSAISPQLALTRAYDRSCTMNRTTNATPSSLRLSSLPASQIRTRFSCRASTSGFYDILMQSRDANKADLRNVCLEINRGKSNVANKTGSEDSSQLSQKDKAMVGFEAMRQANICLEDFFLSYFMFHELDVNKQPSLLFRYLPVLYFAESFMFEMDNLNEKIVNATLNGNPGTELRKLMTVFETGAFEPLAILLESKGLLTERIVREFKNGEDYWMLERKLCSALANNEEILLSDVMRANFNRSADYNIMNLLLYQLRGEEVNEKHVTFLSISEFLLVLADDLDDYENDVLENSYNILRMFVKIYGPTEAPTKLAECISEFEEKYKTLLKTLDPELALNYQKRCKEYSTREDGTVAGYPLGSWNIPPVIADEKKYRSNN